MPPSLRVYVSAASADQRRRLRDAARLAGWTLVDHADEADVVLAPPAEWRGTATDDDSADGSGRPPRLIEALTARELEVLVLLADGRGNRDIAEELGITEHTVKFHLGAIFGKLAASTRTEAVRRALELGLIHI